MLALLVSALFTAYLLIPEGIFRLFFGLFIPTHCFVLTRAEKAYRAVLITVFPFFIALALTWYAPVARSWPFPVRENTAYQRRADYHLVASSFYSEAVFRQSGDAFWRAGSRCLRRQARLLSWYFVFIVLEAFGSGKLASCYLRIENRRLRPLARWVADRLLSAYISQWYVLLTPTLLKEKVIVQADILCENETLYQGEVSQYFLKDGDLSGVILREPRRFDRPAYLRAKENGENPESKAYWRTIPSQNLYFFASQIVNINLTYVDTSGKLPDVSAVSQFLRDELRTGNLQVSIPGGTGGQEEEKESAGKKPLADA